ncbi:MULTISPECIES: hypothetical protein [Sphingomonas]|uniref:hypothetical protein n=1 Tax=Sphingomonas TaxID=13687 RepID=UPI0024130AE6|nr:hypothetical protein [Sphingomonas echinoides]
MTTMARMTVNERLEATGRLDAWNAAVEARDMDAMVLLLRLVAAPDPRRVAQGVLADPEFYGFARA